MYNSFHFHIYSRIFFAGVFSFLINISVQADALDPNIFEKLVEKVLPSVVNIAPVAQPNKAHSLKETPDELLRKFFNELFRRPPEDFPEDGIDEDEGRLVPQMPQGLRSPPRAFFPGTGFIVDASGFIITNHHIVGDAETVAVTFTEAPEEESPAYGQVVGRDAASDLALIKVENNREMVPLAFGDSDQLKVGAYVMAVGNPRGHWHSATHGIISAKGRVSPEFPLVNYLQTDAPINPGNSGGPLVNLQGLVVGVNSAIDPSATGIGFAIPSNLVQSVIAQLKEKGVVSRGYIGVLVGILTSEVGKELGVPKEMLTHVVRRPIVTYIYPGDPADRAGIKPYDIVLEFNRKPIYSRTELMSAVAAASIHEKVILKVLRGNEEKSFTVQIGERGKTQKGPSKPRLLPRKAQRHLTAKTGMTVKKLTPELSKRLRLPSTQQGLVVDGIEEGSPADRAGLLRGDVLLEVDKKSISHAENLSALFENKTKKSYLLRVRRLDPQDQEVFSLIVLDLNEDAQNTSER